MQRDKNIGKCWKMLETVGLMNSETSIDTMHGSEGWSQRTDSEIPSESVQKMALAKKSADTSEQNRSSKWNGKRYWPNTLQSTD